MRPLFALLKPHPYPYGATVLHILGALGGRNRTFLLKPYSCKLDRDFPGPTIPISISIPNPDPSMSASLSMKGFTAHVITLLSHENANTSKNAFEALCWCLETFMEPLERDDSPMGMAMEEKLSESAEQSILYGRANRECQEKIFEAITIALLRRAAHETKRRNAEVGAGDGDGDRMMRRLLDRFVPILKAITTNGADASPLSERANLSQHHSRLDPLVFLEVLFAGMGSRNRDEAAYASDLFKNLLSTLVERSHHHHPSPSPSLPISISIAISIPPPSIPIPIPWPRASLSFPNSIPCCRHHTATIVLIPLCLFQ